MYKPKLNLLDTEKGIKIIKDTFENNLAKELSLIRISSPLYVKKTSGLNDNLSGKEKPVSFTPKSFNEEIEIVHSLAKWKRHALNKYSIPIDKGIYCDMNAIRKDENLDEIHSLYVDQWDWEKHISDEERSLDYLKNTVKSINKSLIKTQKKILKVFPLLDQIFSKNVKFITSQKLLELYPFATSKEREKLYAKKYGTIFIIGIGNNLSNGLPHDNRAPDYDDWNLNGDLLVYYPLLDEAVELSSMGIRVNKETLIKQLTITHNLKRLTYPFHKDLINNELPLSIGGGIGQSRLCLLLLNKIHIGEVQVSLWNDDELSKAIKNGAHIL